MLDVGVDVFGPVNNGVVVELGHPARAEAPDLPTMLLDLVGNNSLQWWKVASDRNKSPLGITITIEGH